jgi:flagellar export protein FliJ
MTTSHTLDNLARLVTLRQGEVDRRQAEIASKQSVRERYQRNLDQLDAMSRSTGSRNACSPSLALNDANYKQTVMRLANSHREDLALHDADMVAARQVLSEAFRRREVLAQLLERQRQTLQRAQLVREQKDQDEMATKAWYRRLA